jgi:hypothetical protein
VVLISSFTDGPSALACTAVVPRAPELCASGFGPSSTFWGAFVDFLQILLSTFCRHYRPRGRPRRRETFARPLLLRWNDLGGYPCRRGDLRPNSGIPLTCSGARLLPEYGGSCALESVPGQVAVKASGGVSERPPIKGCNGVAVDGLGQACRFLASFGLPFALHGYSNEETAHEAPRRLASAEV